MKEPELNQDITILSKITGFVWVSPNIFSPHEMNLNDLDALKEKEAVECWLAFGNFAGIIERTLLNLPIQVGLFCHISGRIVRRNKASKAIDHHTVGRCRVVCRKLILPHRDEIYFIGKRAEGTHQVLFKGCN